MKLCPRLLLPAGVLLLVLGTIAAACSGDDELTPEELTSLEEFFQQVEAIDDDFTQRFDRLYNKYPDAFSEENFETYKAFFGEFDVLFAEYLDELEILKPPSSAEDAFDDLLDTGRELVEALEGRTDAIEGADSFADATQILEEREEEAQVSEGRYQDACQSLRELAADNGILFSFNCGRPS